MKKITFNIVLCLFLFAFGLLQPAAAQRRYRTPKKLLTLSAEAVSYRGDLSSGFSKWGAAAQVGHYWLGEKKIQPYVAASIGTFTAQNVYLRYFFEEVKPQTYVKTTYVTVGGGLHYYFIRKDFLLAYVGQGIGFFRFDPKDSEGAALSGQANTRAIGEAFVGNTVCLPTRLGALYLFKSGFGAGFQASLISPMTDYLDNMAVIGTKKGNDNLLSFQFQFNIPLQFE